MNKRIYKFGKAWISISMIRHELIVGYDKYYIPRGFNTEDEIHSLVYELKLKFKEELNL